VKLSFSQMNRLRERGKFAIATAHVLTVAARVTFTVASLS
jgi:hypothetical protein